ASGAAFCNDAVTRRGVLQVGRRATSRTAAPFDVARPLLRTPRTGAVANVRPMLEMPAPAADPFGAPSVADAGWLRPAPPRPRSARPRAGTPPGVRGRPGPFPDRATPDRRGRCGGVAGRGRPAARAAVSGRD